MTTLKKCLFYLLRGGRRGPASALLLTAAGISKPPGHSGCQSRVWQSSALKPSHNLELR